MACARQICRLQLQHDRHAMAHAVHDAQHEDAQFAVAARVLAPRLLAPRRNGDVVGPLNTQIGAVIGIVLKDVSVARAHVAPLVEKELALLLRVVEAAALRFQMDDQRPGKVDVAVAALERLDAEQDVVAGDRQGGVEAAELLEDLAPDRQARAGDGADLMGDVGKAAIAAVILRKTHMGMTGHALDAEDRSPELDRAIRIEQLGADHADVFLHRLTDQELQPARIVDQRVVVEEDEDVAARCFRAPRLLSRA